MAQETELWEEETSTQGVKTDERKPMESETGTDKASGDGGVGDEQVNRIDQDDADRPTGQDHSTDMTTDREPTEGVGAIQDANIVGTDIADLPDNE
ncbi:MAG: hypothetical protein JO314_06295 [Acidobacteria bacterium]|nr:hypothetical protein [Acidobacteriota bacterium]